MTDDELRALVRDAVARHLGERGVRHQAVPPRLGGAASDPAPWAAHPSHHQYVTLINVGEACLIEPNVACNHCGFCRSHGH